ncbi:MAG: FtsX-like permease family protein [Bryobacteraceae bacterium]
MTFAAALRIALAELRAARGRFLFVVLAVSIGVGALTGVRGFSLAFRHMLLGQARTLMAGDMTLRVFAVPSPEQDAVLRRLESRGVRRTLITETVTMASTGQFADPVLVSLKAVDPAAYPFYGAVELDPPQPLARALTPDTVAVSDDLLLRLGAHRGGMLRVGGQDFRIAATLVSEPDRMTGTLNVGPRLMMTRQGLGRTGLIGLGSRASERYLLRLRATGPPDVAETRAILKRSFPEATIADYRETHPIITRGLDRATTFLSLIGLIALILGAMGVASAIDGHIEQQLDSIAVMKSIGARSSQVIRIYATQTLLLGLSGGALGALEGIAVAAAFPGLLARYFHIGLAASWSPWPAAQGIAIACLMTLLFTVPPLLGIRDIRPALVFRRNVAARPPSRAPAVWIARALILLGTGMVAGTLAQGSWRDVLRTGGFFSISLAIALALLAAVAWLLLRGLKRAERRLAPLLPSTVRHGVANLYRPGNQVRTAVMALGVGVMFTLAVWLIQDALVRQIHGSAPPGTANVFLLDIPRDQRQAVSDLVAAQPGVAAPPEIASSVAARIVAIDGVPIEKRLLRDFNRRFLRTRSVTEVAQKPPDTDVVEGAWWTSVPASPQVCASEETARILHLHPGSLVDWDIWRQPVRTTVACVDRTESLRMTARFEFLFSPGPLTGMPAVLYGSARVRPADVPALQRVMFGRFPTVTVVNVADVMAIVEDVVDRIALVIRFISAFTVLAGVAMVASSVAGTRFRRMREVVVLKTLGATRARIAQIFSVEFFALGAVAGLIGSLLASAFAAFALRRLLDIEFHFDWKATLIATAAAALVAVAAGWLASFRVLGRKPLEILREE